MDGFERVLQVEEVVVCVLDVDEVVLHFGLNLAILLLTLLVFVVLVIVFGAGLFRLARRTRTRTFLLFLGSLSLLLTGSRLGFFICNPVRLDINFWPEVLQF